MEGLAGKGKGGGWSRTTQVALSSLHQLPPQELIPGGPSTEGGTGNVPTQHVELVPNSALH